jgi:hypothetical protein
VNSCARARVIVTAVLLCLPCVDQDVYRGSIDFYC